MKPLHVLSYPFHLSSSRFDMGEYACDGTEFSCPFCTSQLKLKVPSSPAKSEGKPIANMSNAFFPPPGGQCTVVPSAPVPCTPAATPIDPGQSVLKVGGSLALGAGCKFQCAKGGLLTVSSPGQSKFKHNVGGAAASAAVGAAGSLLPPQSGRESDQGDDANKSNVKKGQKKKTQRIEKGKGSTRSEGYKKPKPGISGKEGASVEATSKQLSNFRKQLQIDGKPSLDKSKISIQKRLDEHLIKLDKYKQEGGYTSSIEREIKNFRQELQAIDTVLEEANG